LIIILRKPATNEQIETMRVEFGEMIKLAVDVQRGILAGGGALHADCEEVLLKDGSQQEDVWGADWFPDEKEVGFESLINIRPRQQNFGLEVQLPELRAQIERIVRSFMEIE